MARALRSTALNLSSQGISAASNALFGVLLARSAPVREFVAISGLLGVGYIVPLTATRLTISIDSIGRKVHVPASSASAALLVGMLWCPVAVLAGVLMGVRASVLILFVLALPVLICQDSLRLSALVGPSPHRAVLSDLGWLVLVAISWIVNEASDADPALLLPGAWLLSGVIAAAILLPPVWRSISLRSAVGVLREPGNRFGTRLAESVLVDVTLGLLPVLLLLRHYTDTAASLRGAQLIFGPIQILLFAVTVSAASTADFTSSSNQTAARRLFVMPALGCALVALALAFTPLSSALLGANVGADVREAALPYLCMQLAAIYCQPWLLELRAVRSKLLLPVRAVWCAALLASAILVGGRTAAFFIVFSAITLSSGLLWRRAVMAGVPSGRASFQTKVGS